jgi:hypothetical protein
MLPAGRVLLEELSDRRILAQRLDQLDLRIGRVDEADPHALRRKVERFAMRLGAEHRAVELEALSIDGVATPTWFRRPSSYANP